MQSSTLPVCHHCVWAPCRRAITSRQTTGSSATIQPPDRERCSISSVRSQLCLTKYLHVDITSFKVKNSQRMVHYGVVFYFSSQKHVPFFPAVCLSKHLDHDVSCNHEHAHQWAPTREDSLIVTSLSTDICTLPNQNQKSCNIVVTQLSSIGQWFGNWMFIISHGWGQCGSMLSWVVRSFNIDALYRAKSVIYGKVA